MDRLLKLQDSIAFPMIAAMAGPTVKVLSLIHISRIQKKVKKIQKDLESKQKELDDLKAETILVIRGVSALDKELLGTLVAEAKDALETLEKQLVQAQEEYDEATKTAKRSNYICNELFTWADVYDTANHDERRAILQQFIKEIRVRKDYEISITLNASFNQVAQLKAVSVSYTHLDVYKRQTWNISTPSSTSHWANCTASASSMPPLPRCGVTMDSL